MQKEFKVPEQKAEAVDFAASNPDSYTKFDCDMWTVFYDTPKVTIATAYDRVTPRQIRLALNAAGLRPTVESAVAAGNQDLKDWWEYALDIERNNDLIVSMSAQLGMTSQQVDDLFKLAATL